MKEKQLSRISMLQRVQETLEKHKLVWKDLPQAVRTFEIIAHNNLEIGGLKKQVEKDLSPLINQALRYRKRLIQELIPVASVLQVIAWELRDGKMSTRVDFNDKKLKKMKDPALVVTAHQVLEEAQRILELSESAAKATENRVTPASVQQVGDYGLTREKAFAFAGILKDFEETYMESKDSIQFSAKCQKRISKLLKESNRLLKNKLDLLLTLYETTHPEFYKDYMVSRQLVPPVTPPAAEAQKKTATRKATPGKSAGRGPGRPRKKPATAKDFPIPETAEPVAPKKSGRKPGRPARKRKTTSTTGTTAPRRRGRPPKKAVTPATETPVQEQGTATTVKKPRRRRPPEKETEAGEKTTGTVKKPTRKPAARKTRKKKTTGTRRKTAAKKPAGKAPQAPVQETPVQKEPPKEEKQ